MLGHAVYRMASDSPNFEAFGTLRSNSARKYFGSRLQAGLIDGIDALDFDSIVAVMSRVQPELVVNCVGVIKQLDLAEDPLVALPLNSLFPHRLARICALGRSRLVHISTDCVFRGDRGGYTEDDLPDAEDLYGRSKALGEVDYVNAVTLRTSIVGRELGTNHGLVEWFLGQHDKVHGFTRAIFSGVTTNELARVILEYVAHNSDLRGVWQVSSEPIDKYRLLRLIKEAYGRSTEIEPDDNVVIDRSLNSTKFKSVTGYSPPDWPTMVRQMQNEAPR